MNNKKLQSYFSHVFLLAALWVVAWVSLDYNIAISLIGAVIVLFITITIDLLTDGRLLNF